MAEPQQIYRFSGKSVIVTGAASGLGKAIASRFASEGGDLILADINAAGVADVGATLQGRGGRVETLVADVSQQPDNEAMVARAVKAFGRLDVLVNNAAVGVLARATELDPAEWRRIFATGVDSIFFASRVAIPHLSRTRGAIINTSSISAGRGDYGLVAYNSMKGAVANLTRSLALDHARDGVRVNAVAPGAVRALGRNTIGDHPVLGPLYREAIPLGRFCEPEDVAAAVAFLASEEASYITGASLPVDGGLSAWTGQPNIPRVFTPN